MIYIDFKRYKSIVSLKNIAFLTSGSLVAQAFNILGAPIITRIYDVETIGIYSYILTIVTSCNAILSFRYDLAIVTEENDDNVYALIKANFIIGIITSSILICLFAIYTVYYNTKVNINAYIIILVFIILVTNSILNIVTSYNNRMKEYKVMAKLGIIRTSFQNIGGIIFGIGFNNVFSLLIPYTIGQLLGVKQQAKSLFLHIDKIINVKHSDVIRILFKHKSMAFFSTPAMLANSLSYASVTVFLESLFGMLIVGYYSLSTRILGLPLMLISGNVGKVFFQEAQNEYVKNKKFSETFKKFFGLLLCLAIPIGFTMFVIFPIGCEYIFGKNWAIVGEYIKILTPFFLCRFIGTALSPGLLVSQKQRLELYINILLIITAVFSYIITSYNRENIFSFLWYISISNSLVYSILIFSVWNCSRKVK